MKNNKKVSFFAQFKLWFSFWCLLLFCQFQARRFRPNNCWFGMTFMLYETRNKIIKPFAGSRCFIIDFCCLISFAAFVCIFLVMLFFCFFDIRKLKLGALVFYTHFASYRIFCFSGSFGITAFMLFLFLRSFLLWFEDDFYQLFLNIENAFPKIWNVLLWMPLAKDANPLFIFKRIFVYFGLSDWRNLIMVLSMHEVSYKKLLSW